MKLVNYLSLFAAVVAASACNQPAKDHNTAKTDTTTVKAADSKNADTANTAHVFAAYIALKNQFLKSDVAAIKIAATTLASKLVAVKGCVETATFANKIATTGDVKEQRAAFLTLSSDIVGLVKGSKLKMATIYVDYCPMADAGKGGYWLSLDKKIENPYFPEHMKECGTVKEQLN